MSRRLLVLSVAVLVVLVGSGNGLAAQGPTGDAAAIAFYRQVAAAYRHVNSVTMTRSGYLSYVVAGPVFRYVDGQPAPASFHPGVESITAVLRNGRTVGYVDHIDAAGLTPMTIVENSTGVWAALGSNPSCYFKNPRSSGVLGWGAGFVVVVGNFGQLKRSGGLVTVRSSYPWGKTGEAVEVDHFFAASKYWQSFQVHVTGATGSFGWSFTGFHESNSTAALPTTPHC